MGHRICSDAGCARLCPESVRARFAEFAWNGGLAGAIFRIRRIGLGIDCHNGCRPRDAFRLPVVIDSVRAVALGGLLDLSHT
jgi:hypothetical protein